MTFQWLQLPKLNLQLPEKDELSLDINLRMLHQNHRQSKIKQDQGCLEVLTSPNPNSGSSNLTDEAGGCALSDPQAEFPLLPLPQLSLSACGDEDGILINQRLMKNLERQTG